MKKLLFAALITTSIFSCKKEEIPHGLTLSPGIWLSQPNNEIQLPIYGVHYQNEFKTIRVDQVDSKIIVKTSGKADQVFYINSVAGDSASISVEQDPAREIQITRVEKL
jgi:hypothetical protein